MASNPPYIPNLPPNIRQEFLNRWPSPQTPMPTWSPPVGVPQPAPAPAQTPAPAQNGDAVAGTWVTSGGAWHFTKDGDGYTLVETSPVLGQTGQGRAWLKDATLSIEFTSALLGQMSLTFRLAGRVLEGTMPILGIPVPFVLQRA